jgi:hypothetical protein
MTAAFQTLIFLALVAISGACGFFGRGWYDGTLISRTEAEIYAQGRADQAAKSAVDIERATVTKEAALRQLNSARAPVSRACPPGTGAVSDAAFERYMAAGK